jgi:hypothetical protein
MNARVQEELAMLRGWWPDLEFREPGLWVRLRDRALRASAWRPDRVDVAFQIPELLPGQAPYGFYVLPGLTLPDGRMPENYTYPSAEPPFDGSWGKFSWSPVAWRTAACAAQGDNMVSFVHSILSVRLQDGS